MKAHFKKYSDFWLAIVSFVVYYCSLPPIGLKYTIFFAPAIWTYLIVRRVDPHEPVAHSHGRFFVRALTFPFRVLMRGEYRRYWLASLCFWLTTVVWVSYPHPATILGWLALSGYLALYFPLFIFESRVMTRVLRLPLWLAAPLAWTSCEALRNVVMGGFSFAGLSHALYRSGYSIQLAELLGEYGVGAWIVLVGALYGLGMQRFGFGTPQRGNGSRYVSFAFLVLLANLLFGYSRIMSLDELEAEARGRNARPLRVALLQDSTTYRFPISREKNVEVSDRYLALATEASRTTPRPDVIIWPEGTYYHKSDSIFWDLTQDCGPLFEYFRSQELGVPTAELSELEARYPEYFGARDQSLARDRLNRFRLAIRQQRRRLAELSTRLRSSVILGASGGVGSPVGEPTFYNSAVFVPYFGDESDLAALGSGRLTHSPTNAILAESPDSFRRYDKIDLVMFGEYVPFLRYFPKSWNITTVCAETALGRGSGPVLFEVSAQDDSSAHYRLAPHICFESSIPHFITRQLSRFRDLGVDPDALLCISNDGWFRNGAETDLHLATQVFRAVENRRSVLASTHGGFSAWIDASGRVRASGSRGNDEVVVADVYCVKTRPLGMLRVKGESGTQSICLFDIIRRAGYVIFIVTIIAQLFSLATRRRPKGDAELAHLEE